MMPQPNASPEETLADAGPPDELLTISRWELDALRAMASGASARPDVKTPEPVAAPVPVQGKLDVAEPDARDRRTADLERAYRAAIRDRELATALAGRPLVPGAAAQLIKLWRDDFDVIEQDGELRVAARDGRPVGKAVGERLAEAEYAHFCPSTPRGGAAGKGASRASGPGVAAAPRTLGEAALMQWREAATSRTDPSSGPIGLRRR
jgi:hypothetical protein